MPQLDMKAVTGCEVTAVTALSANKRSSPTRQIHAFRP